ncbi:hypothetical protein B0T36_01690 [Nocardia donostiensis]|nr:hypothetical protein B0T36_01690 [Nocardia donostiensis]
MAEMVDTHDGGPPRLAEDGVTILRHRYGKTSDGTFYAAVEELRPGDPGYDQLLPAARRNPDQRSEATVNPATLSRILRDAGVDESDLEDK